MSDILRMTSPKASPDALRQLLRLSKSFYDLHTPRFFGYTDIDGLQYVGSTANFGSEILLETRKLRMNRPPEKVINPSALLSYYFNISHSDFIEAYPQQNMLMGCVKKDVLLSNHTYQLRFSDVTLRYFARAEAYSDRKARISAFYATTANPVLVIDEDEYPLYVDHENNSDEHVTWYFAINQTTDGMYTADIAEGTVVIDDLTKFIDLPALWLCVSSMRMLPDIKWKNGTDPGNIDTEGRPLVEYGVNGDDTIFLYPYMYGHDNVPSTSVSGGYWYVKVYGEFSNTEHSEFNLNTTVHRIGYIHCQTESFTDEPDFEYYFTYDEKYAKVSLTESGIPRDMHWTFRRAEEGDYDYDDTTPYQPINACMFLAEYEENNAIESLIEHHVFYPLFKVSFKDIYFHPYESEINAMNAGVHLDVTTDYSDNCVDKRFGVIRDLCEFDGLPSYYKYYMDRTIHHAHAELYAIRDDANVKNQHAMDKQTSAVILDSAVPITDYAAITADMKPVIVYEGPHTFKYITNPAHIISDVNFLSDTGFIDKYHFCDVTIPGAKYSHRFVYHGNRYFSTGVIDIDPSTEYGRGYLITNDPATYENNSESKTPKAPRTAARICDIPTSFEQLQNITNVSPTLIIDPDYVRAYASFNEDEYQMLWNDFLLNWFQATYPFGNHVKVYFPTFYELNHIEPFHNLSMILERYGRAIPPLRTVHFNDITFRITNGGSGYNAYTSPNPSMLGFNIGGVFFKIVPLMSGSLNPDAFLIYVNRDIPDQAADENVFIPLANLNGRISEYELKTLQGPGSGAVISVEVPSEAWDAQETGIRTTWNPNLVAFVSDELDRGLYVTKYNYDTMLWEESALTQLTGDLSVGNPVYEDRSTMKRRTLNSTYLYNLLTNRNIEEDNILQSISGGKIIDFQYAHCTYDPPTITPDKLVNNDPGTGHPADLSEVLSDNGLNKWNCFVAAVQSNDNEKYYTVSWAYDMNSSFENGRFGNGNLLFPHFVGTNFSSYDNSWSSVKFTVASNKDVCPFMYDPLHRTYDTYSLEKGDMCLTGRSEISLTSILKIVQDVYPSDAMRLYSGMNLNYNLYRFDHFKPFREYERIRTELEAMSSEELYNLINEKYGEDNDISRYYSYPERLYVPGETYTRGEFVIYKTTTETSLYSAARLFVASDLSHDVANGNMTYIGPSVKFQMMVNYVMARTFPTTVYDNPDLEVYAYKGSSMSVPKNNPIGGYIPLKETVDSCVTVRNTQKTADPLYVFRIDEPISDFNNLKMMDGNVDVSAYTLLIVKQPDGYKKYTYHNGRWEYAYI